MSEDIVIEPSEPAIVIEPIMMFDMGKPTMVTEEFISQQPVQFEYTIRKNEKLIKVLTDKGYKLISTEKQGTIVYGIFQK